MFRDSKNHSTYVPYRKWIDEGDPISTPIDNLFKNLFNED